MAPTRDESRAWMERGTSLCLQALDSIDDAALAEPSALPGWSRAHVVAHLDGNARALTNLVVWASTGLETPMYASATQRNEDIETGAALPAAELRARFAESCSALADGLARLSADGWSAEVRTIQGRTITASLIPWLRSREVMIHAYDLLGGVGFEAFPEDFLVAIIDDIVERRASLDGHPAIVLESPGHRWEIPGAGDPVAVSGSLPQIAAYVSGREPLGPELPAWL